MNKVVLPKDSAIVAVNLVDSVQSVCHPLEKNKM